MIRLRDWPPSAVRRINLRLFDDPQYPYDLDSISGFEPEAVTRRRIANMKDAKIRRVLAAVPDCPVQDEQGFRDWWAHWMPVAAGSQLWPDGNHRTGMLIAELVAEQAGFTMDLDATVMDEMRRQSKELVRERWRTPPVNPEEFRDPGQPLTRFYWDFRVRLRLRPRGQESTSH